MDVWKILEDMKYEPTFSHSRKVVIFDLKKPIYGSYFGVWDKWLKKAEKLGYKLVIHTPFGTPTYESAKEYLKGAERLERYYKNPNEPMIFWGKSLKSDIDKRTKRKKLERKLEDCSLPVDARLKLREKIKRENPELARKLALL